MSQALLALMAELFRTLRKKNHLTQTDLAKRLGISQSTISKIEACKVEPSASQWLRFCFDMGISPDLITGLEKGVADRTSVESAREPVKPPPSS